MVGRRFTVLVVDDSALFRQRVTRILHDRNLHPVLQACNYEEAVNWLLQTRIDLTLLDISMPGKSGIELLKLIKNRYPGTKVWIISNHADEHYKEYCLSTGADCFFDKSLDFEEMENRTAMFCNDFQKSEPAE
ncbi:response regulator [Longitalea luteola]|uniref:response regulator n=1 Tax=Longitalea luteola TaxID=2812563 RepID=UPI001A969778|nr:response regulator transcription factor [Longitalea luteola]